MKVTVTKDTGYSWEMRTSYCCDDFATFNHIWFKDLKLTPKGLFIKKPDDCFYIEEELNARFLCCPFCGEDVIIVGSKQ